MICDEIQCGMGRTGSMFAWQGYGVKPDIMAMAEGNRKWNPCRGICHDRRGGGSILWNREITVQPMEEIRWPVLQWAEDN